VPHCVPSTWLNVELEYRQKVVSSLATCCKRKQSEDEGWERDMGWWDVSVFSSFRKMKFQNKISRGSFIQITIVFTFDILVSGSWKLYRMLIDPWNLFLYLQNYYDCTWIWLCVYSGFSVVVLHMLYFDLYCPCTFVLRWTSKFVGVQPGSTPLCILDYACVALRSTPTRPSWTWSEPLCIFRSTPALHMKVHMCIWKYITCFRTEVERTRCLLERGQ
jgi:hypothetical protein